MTRIEKVENGYILSNDHSKEIVNTTDDLFKRLLLILEGRSENFTGDMYGRVIIHRSHPETDEFLVRPVAETELMRELAEMKEVNATQAYCLRNHIDSYHDGVVAMGLESDIEELLEHVTRLEAELDARREDSKVLARVVTVAKEWECDCYCIQGRDILAVNQIGQESMKRIYAFVEEYINVPEVTPYPAPLREEIAETLHTLFMTMVQKRQLNGTLPSGKTLCVTYDELADSSKEYLRDQADEILDALRGAQRC